MFMNSFNYLIRIHVQKLIIGVLALALLFAAYDNKFTPLPEQWVDILFGFDLCLLLGYMIQNVFSLSRLFEQQENFEKFQKSCDFYKHNGHFSIDDSLVDK